MDFLRDFFEDAFLFRPIIGKESGERLMTSPLQVVTTDAVAQVVEYSSIIGDIIICNGEDSNLRLLEVLLDKKEINREAVFHDVRQLYNRNNYLHEIFSLCGYNSNEY